MSRYRIEFTRAAAKELRAIRDWRVHDALEAAIEALADDPRPPGCRKLAGRKDEWRIRVGDWRVIYRVEGEEGSGPGPIHRSGGAMEPTSALSASEGLRLVVLVVSVGVRGGGCG